MIDVSLGAYIAGLTSYPVQQDTISQDDTESRVWFQRTSAVTDLFLTQGVTGLTTSVFSVEVMGLDIDDVQAQADAIKVGLNGFLGPLSADDVLLVTVEDASDEYIPKNMGDDTGLYVAAFEVTIIQA